MNKIEKKNCTTSIQIQIIEKKIKKKKIENRLKKSIYTLKQKMP